MMERRTLGMVEGKKEPVRGACFERRNCIDSLRQTTRCFVMLGNLLLCSFNRSRDSYVFFNFNPGHSSWFSHHHRPPPQPAAPHSAQVRALSKSGPSRGIPCAGTFRRSRNPTREGSDPGRGIGQSRRASVSKHLSKSAFQD